MKKHLRSALALAMTLLPLASQAETLSLYADATDKSNQLPVNVYYSSSAIRSQMIYPADMLTEMQGKVIDKVSFTLVQMGTLWKNNAITLKMGVTQQAAYESTNYIETGLQTVATTAVTELSSSTPVPYTWEIALDEPYTYTGGNLILDFSNVAGTGNGRTWNFSGATQTTVTGLSKANSVQQVKFLPSIVFDYSAASSQSVAVSTREISFPLAFTGEDNYQTLTITNTGTNTIEGTIQLQGDAFSLSTTAITALAAGASMDVTVDFDTLTEGDHTGTININIDGLDPIQIALQGTAVNAPADVRCMFNQPDYDTQLPAGWTPYAEEMFSTTGAFEDATTNYDDFGSTLRFESANIAGLDALQWNHANPMAYTELYTRAYYIVSPEVGGTIKFGAILTDLPATGATVAAYPATYNALYGRFMFDEPLDITWSAPLSQNGWSIATAHAPSNARIVFMLKYAALDFFAAQNDPTSVNETVASEAPVEYYTLQGIRLNNRPTHGLFIERQGNKTMKVMIP